MATTQAKDAPEQGQASNSLEGDPFNTTPQGRSASHRYSAFDTDLFSSYTQASPSQAKKALEAHIADTDRRIREASKLGTSLLEQKKQLSERLNDVEMKQGSNEIGPELRHKLSELEKEYNDLGRESARAFIPKSRKTSANPDESGTQSAMSEEASLPPAKSTLPASASSRKQRNTSNKVEDLAFATEISTSLLGQLRHLQNVLAEKEEQLRDANGANAKLTADAETLQFKLRTFDENEQRYKDENWRLETQVQDLIAQAKESALREQKVSSSLNSLRAEKQAAEREADDLKASHSKLSEENSSMRRKHDTEIAAMRRTLAAGENERVVLNRKLTEATSQNEDLAKAVSYRINTNTEPNDQERSLQEEDLDLGNISPELSPPPSPTKGTPRHGGLESETLKSSLHHAHRMIQNLKNNIHREKTERLELRRMLQDARDELEVRRSDGPATANAGKRRKPNNQQDGFKKPQRPDRLGGTKLTKEEILEDSSWEEYDDTPTRFQPPQSMRNAGLSSDQNDGFRPATELEANISESDAFDTAAEQGNAGSETDGFETATEHEPATDAEGYQTAHDQDSISAETDGFETAESVAAADSDGDLTETEATKSPTRKSGTLRGMGAGSRSSFHSTASDDADMAELRTPPTNEPPRYKLKVNRGAFRGRSETPSAADSPASFISNRSFPSGDQDLAAELEDLGDDTSVANSTPSRSIPSQASSPAALQKTAAVIHRSIETPTRKPQMVDAETMTESAAYNSGAETRPSYTDATTVTYTPIFQFVMSSMASQDTEPMAPDNNDSSTDSILSEPVSYQISPIKIQETEPVEPSGDRDIFGASTASLEATQFAISAINIQHSEPIATSNERNIAVDSISAPGPVKFELANIESQHTEPIAAEPVQCEMSSLKFQETEPIMVEPAQYALSALEFQNTEPVAAEFVQYNMSDVKSQDTEPVAPEIAQLQKSLVKFQDTEPVAVELPQFEKSNTKSLDTEPVASEAPQLKQSAMKFQDTKPITPLGDETNERSINPPPSRYEISSVKFQHTEPVALEDDILAERATPYPLVQYELAPVKFQHTEPITAEAPEPSQYAISQVKIQETEPVAADEEKDVFVDPVAESAHYNMSSIRTLDTEPIAAEFITPIVREIASNEPAATGFEKDIQDAPNENLQEPPLDKKAKSSDHSKREPFQPVSGNAAMPKEALSTSMKNEGTQTSVSSDQMDNLLKGKSSKAAVTISTPPKSSGSGRAMSMGSRTAEQLVPLEFSSPKSPKRAGNIGPVRKTTASPQAAAAPPLPAGHKEVIAAASRSTTTPGTPPFAAASSVNASTPQQARPHTANSSISQQQTPSRFSTMNSAVRNKPPSITARSDITRRSSVSSFATEVDERFDINNATTAYPTGTDPRMIQAITQTMIGEFMYKYTRKAGRGDFSGNRHRRFFWIHPYTRTLYWSTHDPSRANRSELKAKSVPIEAVRVVTDSNTEPPGLYTKSIVIITPGRNIKLTAPTSNRHETWFNALSYLLLRDNGQTQEQSSRQIRRYNQLTNYTNAATTPAHQRSATISSLTSEDISEFNPGSASRPTSHVHAGTQNFSYRSYGTGSRTSVAGNRASGFDSTQMASAAVPSLTTRQQRPVSRSSVTTHGTAFATPSSSVLDTPTRNSTDQGTPTPVRVSNVDAQGFKKPMKPASQSTNTQSPLRASKSGRLSSLSGRLSRQSLLGSRSSGLEQTDGGARGREATQSADAAQEAQAAGGTDGTTTKTMENVRACCDGKHDVGSLSHVHHRDTSRSRSRASIGSRVSAAING